MRFRLDREQIMAKKCSVTGKGPMVGNNVSHANNKNQTTLPAQFAAQAFLAGSEKRFVRIRVSTKGIRIIDKHGIEAVLNDMKLRNQVSAQD